MENLERRCRNVVTYLKHFESLNKPDELGGSSSSSSSASAAADELASTLSGAAGGGGALITVSKAEREARAEMEARKQQTLDRLVTIGAYLTDFSAMVQEYEVYQKEQAKSGKIAAAAAAAATKGKPKQVLGLSIQPTTAIGAGGLSTLCEQRGVKRAG